MRRDNRIQEKDKLKTILYVGGSLVAIAILAFVAIFMLYGGSSNENEGSQFSTAKISNLVPNNTMSNTNSQTEEASIAIGKSVNEVKNETNTTGNTTTKKESAENTTKSNNVTNTTKTTNTQQTTTKQEEKKDESSSSEQKQVEKKEAEKDPVFVKPVEGEILREYAKDKLVYSETLKEWITHSGIDIKADKTSVVKCAADGRVASIKNDPRYGLTVVVEHANNFKTVYSNLLTAEFVTEGEEIKSGQTIGTVGNTSTFEVLDEDHLHFEILKNNENVDPSIYIP